MSVLKHHHLWVWEKPHCKIWFFFGGDNTFYATTQLAFCNEVQQQRSVQFGAQPQFLFLRNVRTLDGNTEKLSQLTHADPLDMSETSLVLLITMNERVGPLHVSLWGDGGIKRISDLDQMHNRLNSVHLNLIGILSQREVFFKCLLWWAFFFFCFAEFTA